MAWRKPEFGAENVNLSATTNAGPVCLWEWVDVRGQQACELRSCTDARYLLATRQASLFHGIADTGEEFVHYGTGVTGKSYGDDATPHPKIICSMITPDHVTEGKPTATKGRSTPRKQHSCFSQNRAMLYPGRAEWLEQRLRANRYNLPQPQPFSTYVDFLHNKENIEWVHELKQARNTKKNL